MHHNFANHMATVGECHIDLDDKIYPADRFDAVQPFWVERVTCQGFFQQKNHMDG